MTRSGSESNSRNFIVVSTTVLVFVTVFLPLYFHEQIVDFGKYMMDTYSQRRYDIIVLLLSAISITAVAFPVWTYGVYGKIIIGYNPFRLILIISAGSTLGSYSTYIMGRYFGNTGFFRKSFQI